MSTEIDALRDQVRTVDDRVFAIGQRVGGLDQRVSDLVGDLRGRRGQLWAVVMAAISGPVVAVVIAHYLK